MTHRIKAMTQNYQYLIYIYSTSAQTFSIILFLLRFRYTDIMLYFIVLKVDADELILWKVQIPTNDMNLETEIHANNVKKEFRGKELNPFKNAIDYFNEPKHLSEEVPTEISIIVQLPQLTTTSKCLPMGLPN